MSDHWLLYPGSPFLPFLAPGSVENVIGMINNNRLAPGYAIAEELQLIGAAISDMNRRNLKNLSYQYMLDEINLIHYLQGFITPPQLIIGAYLSNAATLRDIIKLICRPAFDELSTEHNSFKAFHLIRAIEIFQSATDKLPETWVFLIYDHLRRHPFVMDEYYTVGLEASEIFYRGLLLSITLDKPSS